MNDAASPSHQPRKRPNVVKGVTVCSGGMLSVARSIMQIPWSNVLYPLEAPHNGMIGSLLQGNMQYGGKFRAHRSAATRA
jgi:hypothetical protein